MQLEGAADLVRLLQISKAVSGLPVLVYRTKLLAEHLYSNTILFKKMKQTLLFSKKKLQNAFDINASFIYF